MASENENVCKFFKYGFCKFKSNCRKKHVLEVCDDKECNKSLCIKRHPRPCKYFDNNGFCKLGSICAYAHNNHKKNEIQKLELKIDELIQLVKKKEEVIEQLVHDVKELKEFFNDQLNQEIDDDVDDEPDLDDNDSSNKFVYDDEATIEKKANSFINASLNHLDEMEKIMKKSKKNFGEKFKAGYDKMYEEIKKCDIIPSVYNRHHFCTFELFQMESAFKDVTKKDLDNKTEKEQILKVIEDGKAQFKLLLEETY